VTISYGIASGDGREDYYVLSRKCDTDCEATDEDIVSHAVSGWEHSNARLDC
jgi:hypothetical protein